MENYSCDNSGNRMPCDVNMADPVLGSGQKLTPTQDENTEATVVPGAVYAITVRVGTFIFGIADTDTEGNVVWVCPQEKTIIIKIPNVPTYTLLHYQGRGISYPTAYLRRLAMP